MIADVADTNRPRLDDLQEEANKLDQLIDNLDIPPEQDEDDSSKK